ncbi:MAG: sigma-70 family RNA polymerase sigma factor [Proteobacteria bacterium]|nr:sigma-70 family RNA polymerase sigma factor [Pseudomonadota bacterium]MBU1569987.1 sigma-70 family RNA polymerase sigma factor [Pseudomonadota bacterium]
MQKIPERKKIIDEDTELINAINSGQKSLFYDLVKKYEQKLYNFGLKVCGETRDAEDMVQETFLNVYRYLADFRSEAKFKNWLYRIAASVCIKKRRKSKFAPQKEISLEDFIPENKDNIPDSLPSWASKPLEKVLNDELSKNIRKAILLLPEKYRVVLVLRDIEGFDTEETAQILNIKPSSVKVRLHRARLFLKEKLKDYFSA